MHAKMIFNRVFSRVNPLAIICVFMFFSVGCNRDDHGDRHSHRSGTVSDIDGNSYQTVIIGTQEWMTSNLRTTRYNDGASIEYPGTDNNAWENNTRGAYSWYKNDEAAHSKTYGALYNWHAVNTGKLCPAGWRVPEDDEWTKVNKYLANNAGGKLKGNSPEYWSGMNTGATNESGFNAFPSGVRFSNLPGGARGESQGYFYYIGETGRWWTSTDYSSSNAWYRSLHSNSGNVYRSHNFKGDGYSVRCVRNLD